MQQRQRKSVTWVNQRHPGAPLVHTREIPRDPHAQFHPVNKSPRRGRALDAAALAATIDARLARAHERRIQRVREYIQQQKRLGSVSKHYPKWQVWKRGGSRRGSDMSNADVLAWIKEHQAIEGQNAAADIRRAMQQSVALLLEDRRRRVVVAARGG